MEEDGRQDETAVTKMGADEGGLDIHPRTTTRVLLDDGTHEVRRRFGFQEAPPAVGQGRLRCALGGYDSA